MKKITTKDLIAGGFFVLLGIIILIYSQQIVLKPNLTEPGGRLFPQITGIGMIICGIGAAFYSRFTFKPTEDQELFLNKQEFLKLLLFFGILIVYYIAMRYVGYLISTPIACFALIQVLKGKKKASIIVSAIISLAITAILYYAFYYGFYIYLPTGILFA